MLAKNVLDDGFDASPALVDNEMYMRGYRFLYSIGLKVNRANPDVIVIGGGPAGSTTSTLIAQRGYRVHLFERDRFPRFHIGESLIPETYWVLQRLNMLPKMQASPFVKKYSVQFVNSQGRNPRLSISGTTSRTSARRPGRSCAASSTR